MWGGTPMAASAAPMQASANLKHDVFVGNLSFNTTEEQLHTAFSEVGRVLNVRMVTDQDTGKPRGFAFVEFDQAQSALSAIRNMNDYELNGRRLRVNFSNSSHLEALAGKLGMDLSQQTGKQTQRGTIPKTGTMGLGGAPAAGGSGAPTTGTNAVADSLKALSKGEMYDVVAKLKEIADRDPDEARRVISGHPQLPEALLYIMSKLEMIKTPLPAADTLAIGGIGSLLAPPAPVAAVAAAPVRAADPRAAQARVDPRQQLQQQVPAPAAAAAAAAPPTRVDPRQRADPRAAARAPPPPPPPPPPRMMQAPPQQATQPQPQPPPPPPPPMAYPNMQMPPQQQQQQQQPGFPNLDPELVKQVMSITPEQLQQLPPDKQQSILQLRQQIAGSM
jgi:cleavage stimulation factor subunit 2